MKVRIILASIVLALLGTLLFSEVNFVQASSNTEGGSPVSSYTISGKVLYRYAGWFKPATSAAIEALNVRDRQKKFTTVADRLGNYSLVVPSSEYKVRAFDSRDTIFLPVLRYVSATTSAGVNFQGVVRAW